MSPVSSQYAIEAQTVIESASLELSAAQLEVLANAAPHLQEVCEGYMDWLGKEASGDPTGRPEAIVRLDPVMALLSSIASIVDQTGLVKPKRYQRKATRKAKKD